MITTPTRLKGHQVHASGARKTVCVTACLTALGVPVDSFHTTGTLKTRNYLKILNRHGFSTRSRKSSLPTTIGACRKAIEKRGEDCIYFVVVMGKGYCHALLLDSKGQTVIDTAPRKRDKRAIHSIHAVTRMA